MKKIFFKEEQKFSQWWLWVVLLAIFAVSVGPLWVGLWSQLSTGVPWGDNPADDVTLAVITGMVTLLVGGIIVLILLVRLQTEINEEGITFRYKPFIRSVRTIARDEIAGYKAGKYHPIAEYGGWGVRQGFRKRKVAYNVSGNEGLTLTLKNGETILIGTRRLQAISAAMEKMMNGKRHGLDPG